MMNNGMLIVMMFLCYCREQNEPDEMSEFMTQLDARHTLELDNIAMSIHYSQETRKMEQKMQKGEKE